MRSACEVLGRLVSLRIAALADRELATQRAARRGLHHALAGAMRAGRSEAPVLFGLMARPQEVAGLVGADGVAALCGHDVVTWGRTPTPDQVCTLADWLDARNGRGDPGGTVYATASLAAALPEAAGWRDVASGVLTFGLPGTPRRRVIWLRPEIVHTVNWGGDPNKPAEAGPEQRLHPRRSFELWKQEVHCRARPWTPSDVEAAEELRRTAVEIDLGRQVEREQRAVRARDELVAVVSHDLRNPLGIIRMQVSQLLRSRFRRTRSSPAACTKACKGFTAPATRCGR